MVGRRHRRRGDGRPPRRHLPVPNRLRRRRGRVPPGRPTRAARADVPEPPADARVRGSRRADEADPDDALRDDRGPGRHHAVRRRGRSEGRLRARRRATGEDRSVRPPPCVPAPALFHRVAGMDEATVERLLAEQRRYYRERAPEYDDWWFRRAGYALDTETRGRWFADVRELEAALEAFGPRGDALELAAGTGIWSRQLLRSADR